MVEEQPSRGGGETPAAGAGFDFRTHEPLIYQQWEAAGHFHAEPDAARQPFVMVIPPPNVTGALHLGHALNNTLQDILIRRKRMQGFNACWLPGTDHAGIATQAVVEKRLREDENLSRHEVGRDGLVRRIWEWKKQYGSRILDQLRRMGCSCDWPRTRFTLDEQCAAAVYETFFRFFRDGLIYRGLRLVNWDTQLQTAVADDEVYHETVRGSLWHIRYPIVDAAQPSPQDLSAALARSSGPDATPGRDYLIVATTRPETMLADTAVAVHPDDERYQHLIGRHALLPLMNRPIPIVADGLLVKREFGTGCVKVTPGHDPNDYACWQRKLGRPDEIGVRDLLTPDGRIRPDHDPYSGLKKEEARKRVVADLEALGLLEQIEPYETEVGHSDRSKTPIEPLRSEQWFVAMDKSDGPRLAELAMEAVRDGRVRFFPQRYAKTYLDWLGEKRDWCISRQLWWGHRIPVWTRTATRADADRLFVALDATGVSTWGDAVVLRETVLADGHVLQQVCLIDPEHDAIARVLELEGFTRDPDVLDTWFSSALWPHSTFGWPASAARDLEYFYPTSVLSTAREIITLWVARMVLTGLYNTGRVPFQQVYIHPVIQDGQGRPMKKSLGNGVDPVDIIEAYGADALRFTLAQLATETQDIRIPVKPVTLPDGRTVNSSERFELGRNLATKLWQAAVGFVIPTCRDVCIEARPAADGVRLHTSREPGAMPLFEKWIRVKLSACIREVDARLERYEFAAAMDAIRTFFWNDLCDWYIEEVKSHLRDAAADEAEKNDVRVALLQVFDLALALFQPVMPFVTEAIWAEIGRAIPRHHELIWPADRPLPAVAPALIVAPWPRWESVDSADGAWLKPVAEQTDAEHEVDVFLAAIRSLREVRTSLNAIRSQAKQPALRQLPAAVIRADAGVAARLRRGAATIVRLAQVEKDGLTIGSVARPPQCMSRVLSVADPASEGGSQTIEVCVPVAGLADLDIERKRLAREIEEKLAAAERLKGKLANEGFIAKAKAEVIEAERARLRELDETVAALQRNLAELA